jgi:spore coat polysaccharide biosynthesis predicted glycosyltransferase SpsG/RimJ/RimL family protein N-acetyltransferase
MNISAREASIEDSLIVHTLRNQPKSVSASTNQSEITKTEHDSWYKTRLKLIQTQPFWIFSDSKSDVGYVRLENSTEFENCFEISISIDENLQNQGVGTKILNQSLNMLSINFASKRIIARIKENNTKSIKLFKKVGFKYIKSNNKILIYEKQITPVRFVFRADASSKIGAGHVMRLFGLLQKYQVVFIGDISEFGWILEKIKALNCEIFSLEESKFTMNKFTDILVLDSYHHDTNSNFLELEKWKLVIVFFDEYTPDYKASLKIHPGLRKYWPEISNQNIISGSNFIPIRKSIKKVPKNLLPHKLVITVVGGGIDKFNFASEISEIISEVKIDCEVNFFTNKLSSIRPDHRFNFFPFGDKLDAIGNRSELVFTTASTTCLEFIARGCTVGICHTTQNQTQYYEELPKLGLAIPIGQFINGVWNLDSEIIKRLIVSKEFRKEFVRKSSRLIDLDGARRVLNEIISLTH